MLSKPIIIAILVTLCLAVIYLSLRIGFWVGAVSAKKLRATNPHSSLLSWVSPGLFGYAAVICVLLTVPLGLGSAAPSGSFFATYFGELGWPSLVLLLIGPVVAAILARVLKRHSDSRSFPRES